jgi:hypothetical protein
MGLQKRKKTILLPYGGENCDKFPLDRASSADKIDEDRKKVLRIFGEFIFGRAGVLHGGQATYLHC